MSTLSAHLRAAHHPLRAAPSTCRLRRPSSLPTSLHALRWQLEQSRLRRRTRRIVVLQQLTQPSTAPDASSGQQVRTPLDEGSIVWFFLCTGLLDLILRITRRLAKPSSRAQVARSTTQYSADQRMTGRLTRDCSDTGTYASCSATDDPATESFRCVPSRCTNSCARCAAATSSCDPGAGNPRRRQLSCTIELVKFIPAYGAT
jgi:hypothetical protein